MLGEGNTVYLYKFTTSSLIKNCEQNGKDENRKKSSQA